MTIPAGDDVGPNTTKVLRVVQWATGRIGQTSLRELIRSPQFELVGVYVHSPAKEGQDAGDLCALPPVGVAATCNQADIIALKPDCIVAMQEGPNLDDVCRFLAAGINVATSQVFYLAPDLMDAESRRRIESACREGGASIHSTGSSPGFSSESLPLVVASLTRRIDRLTIDEFADLPASCPDVQVLGMGFGADPGAEFNPHLLAHMSQGYKQSISVIARGLGLTLSGFEVTGVNATALERFVLPGGTPIEQGKVAAQRINIVGLVDGVPRLQFRINWYCTTRIDADWDLRRSGWRLLIEGDTPVDVNVTFPVADEHLATAMAGLTAYRVVNAVPYLCAAAPGFCTTIDLPTLAPRLT